MWLGEERDYELPYDDGKLDTESDESKQICDVALIWRDDMG